VGDDVAAEARAALPGGDRFLARRHGRWHLDLWAANAAQLAQAGLDPCRIETPRLCTRCHPDLFFSHRASGGTTGRFAVLLALR